MNNKPIATKSCLRRFSGGQPPFHFFSRCRARLFAVLALAPLFAVLFSSSALAQVNVAGQLLIDLSATRGTNTAVGMSSIAGETNLIYWTNYGTLGGTFNSVLNSVYASGYAGGTNPPAMTLLTSGAVSALAPEAPAGTRMMVASFTTPPQLQSTSNWTVECWFYNLTTANPRGVFAWTYNVPTTGTDGGEFSAAATASEHFDGNNLNWNPAGTAPSTSVWHHGVITYDGTTESVYLDGVLDNSAVQTLHIDVESVYPVLYSQLANPPTGTSSSFNGAIAALRVHTEALAASDVANNYAAGIAAVPAAPTNSIWIDSAPATAILGTTATLNGVLNATTSPGTTALTFFYDTVDHGDATNAWPHSVTATTPVSIPGTFSANLSSLTIGTKYYVRIYAVNANATNMSDFVETFITQGLPVVANVSAFFLQPNYDNLIANLVNDGTAGAGASVTFYYGPTDGGTVPANWANAIPIGAATAGQVFVQTGALDTLGNYYFTVAAQNTYGTAFATPSMAFQEGLMFSLNTANLPANGASVTSYPTAQGALAYDEGTFSVSEFGGQKWLNETATAVKNMWLPFTAFPGGTVPATITINGGTIVAAFKPEGTPNTTWASVANVFFSQLGIALDSATDDVAITGNSVASVTISAGGSGYTSPPTVTFAPPGGIPAMDATATGTAQISAAGAVTNVIITSGGSGYPWIPSVINAGTLKAPTVTFSGGGGSGAAATANLTAATGTQLLPEVNSQRPPDTANGMNVDGNGNGNNTANRLVVPMDQVSVVSVVAGDGRSSGYPGDNNYRVYVNGIEVMDTDYGFVSGVSFTTAGSTNGTGYTNSAGANVAPTVTFSAPTGANGVMATATGVAVMGTGANLGHINRITITSPGSGYTGDGVVNNATVTFSPSPNGVTAVGTVNLVSLGGYTTGANIIGAKAAGENGTGMTELAYNTPTYYGGAPYGANATFNIGNDGNFNDGWTYTGYLGNVSVYGEALNDVALRAVENAIASQAAPTSPLTYAITYTSDAHSTITPIAYFLNSSAGGTTTVYEGENQTYTFAAANGFGLLLSVDGSTAAPVSPGSTYTFTNVNATHTIALTSIAIPDQTVTVTYGATGTVTTNGAVIPSGTAISGVPGGSTLVFNIVPNPGNKITSVTLNGTAVAASALASGVYTYLNVGLGSAGTNDAVNITFSALPAISPVASHVPESQALLFGVDTASLPLPPTFPAPTTITNWPIFYSTTPQTNLVKDTINNVNFSLAQTYVDANGVVWENNIDANAAPTTCYQLYPTTLANGTSLPNTGGTIITVVSPNAVNIGSGGNDVNWHSIVDVFFGCLEIGVNPVTGQIQAYVDNDQSIPYDGTGSPVATSTVAIPNGTNAVLSLVANPDGSFAVYYNTILVITNAGIAGPGGLYLTAGREGQSFAANITLGDDGPDNYNAFNGLIGNTYVWTTALTQTERTNLEAALMTQFHAVVPPNFNWVGPDGGNWSDILNWSNTVPLAVTAVPGSGGSQIPAFSLAGAGLTVNLDAAESVAGLIFSTNTVIDSPAGNTLTLFNGTANPNITVSNGALATIDVVSSLLEGLNLYGPGTLTLATNVTLGATISSYLEIAQDASSTASVVQTGGTLTTFSIAQSWAVGNGPGVMLGGADNSATSASYSLSGGTLITPNIGCVTENFGVTPNVLVPPATDGATAILYLNGGVLQASDNDSVDANALAEGSAHLIFNTTHTYVQTGGAIINTAGYLDSIAVPLEHYPGGPGLDGGLIKLGAGTLTLLNTATYTGPTVVSNGILACETLTSLGGNSVTIVPGAQLQLDYTGTIEVYALTTNGTSVPPGVYGSTASGAAHADDTDFVPGTKGTLTVLGTVTTGETPKFTSTAFTGSAGNGNLVLSGTGGIAGGTFLVVGSTNVAAPLADWVTLGQGTFTGAGFSVSIPVTTALPQEFIRVVVP